MREEPDRAEVISRLLDGSDYQGAVIFARSVKEGWERGESLAQIARALVAAGRLAEARHIWAEAVETAKLGEKSGSSQDSIDSSSVLWELAEDVAKAGEVDAAYEIATKIKDAWKKQRALQSLEEITGGMI